MMVRFLLMLIAFYLSLASHALTISADILNSELKKNYSDNLDFAKAGSLLKELLNK